MVRGNEFVKMWPCGTSPRRCATGRDAGHAPWKRALQINPGYIAPGGFSVSAVYCNYAFRRQRPMTHTYATIIATTPITISSSIMFV